MSRLLGRFRAFGPALLQGLACGGGACLSLCPAAEASPAEPDFHAVRLLETRAPLTRQEADDFVWPVAGDFGDRVTPLQHLASVASVRGSMMFGRHHPAAATARAWGVHPMIGAIGPLLQRDERAGRSDRSFVEMTHGVEVTPETYRSQMQTYNI